MNNTTNVDTVVVKSVQQETEFKVPQDPWAYVYAGMVLVLVLGAVSAIVAPFFVN